MANCYFRLCFGLVVISGLGNGCAFASNDSAYLSDKESWVMFAEAEVAVKLHRKEDVLNFADEEMFLTRKPEKARDPVVICGTVALTSRKGADMPVRFISNGDAKGTFIDDKEKPFHDRWAASCKTI